MSTGTAPWLDSTIVAGKRRPRRCRICRRRPPWTDKNCPSGVCKRCYHKHVWPDRPDARGRRQNSGGDPDPPWPDEPFAGELP